MRRTRWLFLAAIPVILFSIGASYLNRKISLAKDAPTLPKTLEAGLDASIPDWKYTKSIGTRPVYQIIAKSFRQIKDPSTAELEGLELRLYHKEGTEYDLVRSVKAEFDRSTNKLYSDGDVDITMGVPVDGPPHGRLLKIHASGVSFESMTGKATTTRRAEFEFDQGSGSSAGAEYDPDTRELHLMGQVALDWRGKSADFTPMHIEAGEAFYKEKESKIILLPWSKLTRDTLHMDAAMSVVTLDKGNIQLAEVQSGRGVKEDPDRKVEFAADKLTLHFSDGMQVSKVEGDRNGKLISTAQTMRTTVTGDRLELDFDATGSESTLKTAVSTGSSAAEAQPLAKAGSDLAETRILRSDAIQLKMKPGGRDIDTVETSGPGTIDFLPNRPGQPKRFLKGDRIWMAYGADNRIQSFRSVNVLTRTNKPPQSGQPPPPPAVTESKEFLAVFDPKTSELTRLDQKTDFRYEEGLRHARANSATLEQQQDRMTLDGSARVWDDTGATSAARIVMNQKSGDFTADGNVASTRQPDKNAKSSGMLSNQEVMQARAQRMVSTDNNLKIHYEGNAVAWQGANRVEADRIDIDRDRQVMEAHGKVVSQFVDKDKSNNDKDSAKPPIAPIFTVVRAPDMVYSDETRVVVYSGGAAMKRPDMTVTAKEIRAFLKDADQDSSLDKAIADGTVKIVSTSEKLKRTRTGTAEHGEYYADDQKVILQGGDPLFVDSVKGQTRGKQLTWWANDDRLLINGADKASPAKSVIRKK